jgi:hypothetical protein
MHKELFKTHVFEHGGNYALRSLEKICTGSGKSKDLTLNTQHSSL